MTTTAPQTDRAAIEAQRFDAKVVSDHETGCLLWCGATNNTGYGTVRVRGRTLLAHRVAYERHIGPIPDGLQIDHLCRIRRCVNPRHLEIVTSKENTLRGHSPLAQSARRQRCPRGHILQGENLHLRPTGHRECLACKRMRDHGKLTREQRAWLQVLVDDGHGVSRNRGHARTLNALVARGLAVETGSVAGARRYEPTAEGRVLQTREGDNR